MHLELVFTLGASGTNRPTDGCHQCFDLRLRWVGRKGCGQSSSRTFGGNLDFRMLFAELFKPNPPFVVSCARIMMRIG